MKKVNLLASAVLAASVLAPVANAAVTPDVAFKGDAAYFRAGVFSRHFNGNVSEVGRLGNEHDTYIELAPSVTLAEVDGTEWRFVSSFAMQSDYQGAWQDTDGYGTGRVHWALTQAFLRVTGLLDSDPNAALWVGRKYVREDSGIVDNKWRNVTGNGIGFENLSVQYRKMWDHIEDLFKL